MKQVVLVTGAASGLGNVIAEYFASQRPSSDFVSQYA